MEETYVTLFQSASAENEQSVRLRKIIRGCKLITDLLPNEDQRKCIGEEKELIQYLLLSHFFHKNSVKTTKITNKKIEI